MPPSGKLSVRLSKLTSASEISKLEMLLETYVLLLDELCWNEPFHVP
jgi:hypothetical protein